MIEPANQDLLVRMRAIKNATEQQTEKRIATFCLDHPFDAATLPITQLAARCDTSTTSIVRFYKHLGFDQIIDFRLALSAGANREQATLSTFPDAQEDIDKSDSLDIIVKKVAANETIAIADTAKTLNIDQLQQAINLIVAANRIDVFGLAASGVVSLDLQHKFSRIGLTAICWQESHLAWTSAVTLQSDAVAIAVSHSGQTPEVVKYLKLAQQAGAKTIAITNSEHAPLTNHADVSLVVAARDTAFRSGALVSRMAQLMVVDCLFIGVFQHMYDDSMQAITRSFEVLRKNDGIT